MKQLRFWTPLVIVSLSCFVNASPSIGNQRSREKILNEHKLLVELTGREDKKITDVELYAQIVSAYEGGNEIAFRSRMQNFMSRFSKSPYADNVLYLAGMLAVNHLNFPDAIRYFGRVEKQYSNGDKVKAANFAKAMTYKKMNLDKFAKQVLTQVKNKFPGSPESFRAAAELKLIK